MIAGDPDSGDDIGERSNCATERRIDLAVGAEPAPNLPIHTAWSMSAPMIPFAAPSS
jgi:hypothetical protein